MPSAKQIEELKRRNARERFLRGRRAEAAYRRQLSSVSKRVGEIVKRYAPWGHVENAPGLISSLNQYAELLKPWARIVTARMHADVSKRDAVSWMELAREMGGILRKEIFTTPTGAIMREAMENQVHLITSLPREAAIRVHKLTTEALIQASRAKEIAEEIMKSGKVTKARAMTIARTETSRTASLLLEARAESIGSTHYKWHTVGDSDVRPEHRRLNGKIFRWDDPPIAGKRGERANPGCIYNCRCWAEPILPEEVVQVVRRPLRRVA
jgi:SPP1 gp7 family putative phage head morphogenesis protein